MDRDYYSDKTINNFIKKDICQNDKLLYKYYETVQVKKFRRRLQILKIDQKVLEQSIYVYITDSVRDIILNFVGKLTQFLHPMGDLIISGGEAFNTYFDKGDRIVTSDIDTKFIPIFKTDNGKLIGPSYYKYFGYLQAVKIILWDYLGKNCALLSTQIHKRLEIIKKEKIARLLGISLPTTGPYVTRRYTLIKKSKQSSNNSRQITEGNVLIDVELFALDLNLKYYSVDDNQNKERVLGGILDIAIMRPFEVGYEVAYSREKGTHYLNKVTQKVIYNPNILIAGKKFLVEDLYLLKSLGLRPKKKVKDRKRMLGFSRSVLKIKNIKSTDSDEDIFKKALKNVSQLKSNKINLKNRPVIESNKIIQHAQKINLNKHANFTTIPNKRKIISQFLYGLKGPRKTPVKGFTKTSGPYRFNIDKKEWIFNNRTIYIKNKYNFRPNKRTLPHKMNVPPINHTNLYSYVSMRNNWVPKVVLKKAAHLPFIGLKK
jgi:hypothetical protein